MRRAASVLAIALPAVLIGATSATAVHRYSDVPHDHAHAVGIHWTDEQGLVQGYPDGTFRPAEPVTRGQLATVLERQRAFRGPVYSLTQQCGTLTMIANEHNGRGSGPATVEYALDGGTRHALPAVPADEPLTFVPVAPGLVTLFVDGVAWASTPTGETCSPPT